MPVPVPCACEFSAILGNYCSKIQSFILAPGTYLRVAENTRVSAAAPVPHHSVA